MHSDARTLSRATYCYEAVQRIFRPRMIGHLRFSLTAKYGSHAASELKGCFGAGWPEIEESARRFNAASALEAEAVDEFDYLGVNHFHAVAGKFFDLLFPVPGQEARPLHDERRRSVLRALKDVKDLRDGMSHPVDADFSVFDALFTMRAAARVLGEFDSDTARRITTLMELTLLRPTPVQALTDPGTLNARNTLEDCLIQLGPGEAYSTLADLFEANASALADQMPEVARAHAAVATALRLLLSASALESEGPAQD